MRIKLINITVSICAIFTLVCCNQIKLNNEEAGNLVIQSLGLPQKFNKTVSNRESDILNQEGYVVKEAGKYVGSSTHFGIDYIPEKLEVTKKGKPYLIKMAKNSSGDPLLTFKTYDIDFGSITGIAIDKEQKTAIVRFTVVATNVTPIANLLERRFEHPLNGELVFKKFDSGWQLKSDQNKTPRELVNDILKSNKN